MATNRREFIKTTSATLLGAPTVLPIAVGDVLMANGEEAVARLSPLGCEWVHGDDEPIVGLVEPDFFFCAPRSVFERIAEATEPKPGTLFGIPVIKD